MSKSSHEFQARAAAVVERAKKSRLVSRSLRAPVELELELVASTVAA
jgi:organic hydroperoxide reductase OsmC/OhrA